MSEKSSWENTFTKKISHPGYEISEKKPLTTQDTNANKAKVSRIIAILENSPIPSKKFLGLDTPDLVVHAASWAQEGKINPDMVAELVELLDELEQSYN